MKEKILDFADEHRRLSIGLLIYIAVFIVSMIYSPWDSASSFMADVRSDPGYTFFDRFVFEFTFYGILDFLNLMYYSMDETLFSGNAMMFLLSGCALFCVAKFLQDTFISDEFDDLPERIAIDFIYDNIFAYTLCVILFDLYSPIAGGISSAMAGPGFFGKAFIVLLVTVFIIVPAVPYLVYIVAYIFSVWLIASLTSYLGVCNNMAGNVFQGYRSGYCPAGARSDNEYFSQRAAWNDDRQFERIHC